MNTDKTYRVIRVHQCSSVAKLDFPVAITVGIVAEGAPGERRVAMTPNALSVLNKTGATFLMQSGAGDAAGFPDSEYIEKGVKIAVLRDQVFAQADVLLQVRSPGANP